MTDKPSDEEAKPKADVTEEKPVGEKKEKSKAEAPKEETKEERSKKQGSQVETSGAVPAQVVKVFKKVGLYGECYQCLARVLEGKNKGTLLRRNVRGPVRENDLLMLKETERDVRAV